VPGLPVGEDPGSESRQGSLQIPSRTSYSPQGLAKGATRAQGLAAAVPCERTMGTRGRIGRERPLSIFPGLCTLEPVVNLEP
jgi:hypothetical protein